MHGIQVGVVNFVETWTSDVAKSVEDASISLPTINALDANDIFEDKCRWQVCRDIFCACREYRASRVLKTAPRVIGI